MIALDQTTPVPAQAKTKTKILVKPNAFVYGIWGL